MPSAKSRVFISAAEILVPPHFGLHELADHVLNPSPFSVPSKKQQWNEISVETLELQLDPNTAHHPSARDTKSMRLDVVAMCVCLGRMLEQFKSHSGWADVPILMSTGPNASGMANEIESIYELMLEHLHSEPPVRNQQVQSDIHPLFALRGLTNSAQAYAAQLFGFRGQNGTYGSTSYGTFMAFSDAVAGLQAGEYDRAVIGASNGGGLIAQLMNSGLSPWGQNFRESTVAVSLILESEEGLQRREARPLAEVVNLQSGQRLPEMESVTPCPAYQDFRSPTESAIFSGGSCDQSFAAEHRDAKDLWPQLWSTYPLIGSSGCASFLLNVAMGCELIGRKTVSSLDCLDRDFYSRESLVNLRSVP